MMIRQGSAIHPAPAPLGVRSFAAALRAGIVHRYRAWRALERQRAEVARMTARDAADIGVTRQQLEFELQRPNVRAIRWL